MAATASIRAIADALEMQFDEVLPLLNLDTGEVHEVSLDMLSMAEEGDDASGDLPEWQLDQLEEARQIVASDRFVRLPSKFDVHEWEIMREFAESVEPEDVRDELLRALHGKGAFRYFKDTLHRHRLQEHWYVWRTRALREIAIRWCEENEIPYRED